MQVLNYMQRCLTSHQPIITIRVQAIRFATIVNAFLIVFVRLPSLLIPESNARLYQA